MRKYLSHFEPFHGLGKQEYSRKIPCFRKANGDKWHLRCYCLIVLCFLQLLFPGKGWPIDSGQWKQTFPKIMGINIGAKNYHEKEYQQNLARLDIVILGFYRGWNKTRARNPIRHTVQQLKSLNPRIKLGQYTILNEAYDKPKNKPNQDKYLKLYKENWWLKNAAGKKVQWTSLYDTWEVNFTDFTHLDEQGIRYPQWLARRDYKVYFEQVPEFDIWYFDNVMSRPRIKKADWNLDGKDDSCDDSIIQTAYRKGHVSEWLEARKLAPDLVFIGNPDDDLSTPEYKGKLQGAVLEGLMGKDWSIEERDGWQAMMTRYSTVMTNTEPPHIVAFNVWGNPQDLKFFRYAFTSCLLNDGYFSFTDNNRGYSSVPWFDEYDIDLGRALDLPAKSPWKNEVYKREFENGMVLVNPTDLTKLIELDEGYEHFLGMQDRITNNGKLVTTITLSPRDGIVLIRKHQIKSYFRDQRCDSGPAKPDDDISG